MSVSVKNVSGSGGSSKPKNAKEWYCISNSTENIPANAFVKTKETMSYNTTNSGINTSSFSTNHITGQYFPIEGTNYSVCMHATPSGSYISDINLVLYSHDNGVVKQCDSVNIKNLFYPTKSQYSQNDFKYSFIPINEYTFAMISGYNSGYVALSVFQAEFDTLSLLTYTYVSSDKIYLTGLCGVASDPIQGQYIDIFTIQGGTSIYSCTYTVYRFDSQLTTLTKIKGLVSMNDISQNVAYNCGELIPLKFYDIKTYDGTYKYYLFCCSSYGSSTKTVMTIVRLKYEYNGELNTNNGIYVLKSAEYDAAICDASPYPGGLQYVYYPATDSTPDCIMCVSNHSKNLSTLVFKKPLHLGNSNNTSDYVSVTNTGTAFSITGMKDITGNRNTNMSVLWSMRPCKDTYNHTIQVFGYSDTKFVSSSSTYYCMMSALIWYDTLSDEFKTQVNTYDIVAAEKSSTSILSYGIRGMVFSERPFALVVANSALTNPSLMYLIPVLRPVVDQDGESLLGIAKQSMNKNDIKVVYLPE